MLRLLRGFCWIILGGFLGSNMNISQLVNIFKKPANRKGVCNIYKTNNSYKIITQVKVEAGYYLDCEPVFILPLSCSRLDFGNKVIKSLKQSKRTFKEPTREEFPSYQKSVLSKIKEKSYLNLYKNSSSCNLSLENNILRIYPEKFFDDKKPNSGLILIETDMKEIFDVEKNLERLAEVTMNLLNKKYR